MRGFPLLRIAGVAAALMLLGVPVWMLTRDRVDAAPDDRGGGVVTVEKVVFSVVLTSTAPARLSVMAANLPIQESGGGVERFEARFEMSRSRPEDLVVGAAFEGNTGAEALRAQVRADGRMVADKTFWGAGEIQDVVEIPLP